MKKVYKTPEVLSEPMQTVWDSLALAVSPQLGPLS